LQSLNTFSIIVNSDVGYFIAGEWLTSAATGDDLTKCRDWRTTGHRAVGCN